MLDKLGSGTNYVILGAEDPAKVVNLSEQQKQRLGPQKLEEMRSFMGRSMQWLNLVLALMMSYLQYGSINTALGRSVGLGWGMSVFFVLILGISFYMVKRSLDYSFYLPPGKR